MNSHKLVMGRKVMEDDIKSVEVYPRDKQRFYSLQYQLSRITKDRGCLKHDDRLDALQMGIAQLIEYANTDSDKEMSKVRNDERQQMFDQFKQGLNIGSYQPKPSHNSWIR